MTTIEIIFLGIGIASGIVSFLFMIAFVAMLREEMLSEAHKQLMRAMGNTVGIENVSWIRLITPFFICLISLAIVFGD